MSQAARHTTEPAEKIYFGYTEITSDPLEALHTCTTILYTLECLIDGNKAIDLQRGGGHDAVTGLSLLLASVREGVERASEAVRAERQSGADNSATYPRFNAASQSPADDEAPRGAARS